MQIARKPPEFQPVTIVLESLEEVKIMSTLMYITLPCMGSFYDKNGYCDFAERLYKTLNEISN